MPRPPDSERAPLDSSAVPTPEAAPPGVLSGEAVFVERIEVAGSVLYDASVLSDIWADNQRLGGPMTLSELRDIAREAQRRIQLDGYVFTRVFAPDSLSAVQGGVATLTVVEAEIVNVAVEESDGSVGPVIDLLRVMAAELTGEAGRNPHIETIERVLLLMRDVPGVTRATAVPTRAPGYLPGQLDLVINVERKPVSGVVFADNLQSPTVGEGLVGAAVEFGSFESGGDTVRVTALNSFWDSIDDLDERFLGQVEYSRAIGATGLMFDARALISYSEPGDVLAGVDIKSRQVEAELGLEYPILRTRAQSLWVRVSAEMTNSRTETGAQGNLLSDDRIRVAEVSFRGAFRDETGYTRGVVGLRQGLDVFGARDGGNSNNVSRADGDGAATVLFAELEREQILADRMSAYLRLGAQLASDALLSSEEFAVGGASFGRGYDPSEFLGDHGLGGTLELRYATSLDEAGFDVDAEDFGALTLYVFGDYGRVFNRSTGSPRDVDIYSVGGGFRLALPYEASLNLEVAKPLTDLQRTQDDDFRFYFRAQKRF